MLKRLAWVLFFLGVAHIVFGVIRYKVPLAEAIADGFIGQFGEPEIRRTAFWFIMVGPLLMFAGHAAIRAVAMGDLALIRIIGVYLLVTAALGIAAFPASPFWAALVLAPSFIAGSSGRR